MPPIRSSDISLAFDMYGDPNACRHCAVGYRPKRRLTEADVRSAVAKFRACVRPGETTPLFDHVTVMTWFREPDFAENYRELYALEAELSDGTPLRYELLSIWRLARDRDYAAWAAEVGPAACQVTFFGLKATNDWFHRRRGAFDDAIVATERLIEAGIAPRWQLFLTTKILPELPGLLKLAEKMQLRERVADLGSEFVLFAHTPMPDGWARQIEDVRPTAADLAAVPAELIEASKRHKNTPELFVPEDELYVRMLASPDNLLYASAYPERLSFFISGDLDVYSNLPGSIAPWWRLGNLETDGVAGVIEAFGQNRAPGLDAIYNVPCRTLAAECGDPQGQKVYDDLTDLAMLYIGRYCEARPGA